MLYTPDLHYSQQIDELKGHWFGRYRPICNPIVHRVLMVIAITISSLRTVHAVPVAGQEHRSMIPKFVTPTAPSSIDDRAVGVTNLGIMLLWAGGVQVEIM